MERVLHFEKRISEGKRIMYGVLFVILVTKNVILFSGLVLTTSSVVFLAGGIDSKYVSSTAVHTYDFHMFIAIIHHFEALFDNPSWLVSSVGRTLHRYRRGHGFKSRFRPYFHYCPSGAHYCEDNFHSHLEYYL